jgi:hypothetical protein
MTTDVTISCPHCRRQYPMKVDFDRLQRLKTRATCGRCGNAFDVAARVAAATAAHNNPPARPADPRVSPSPAAPPTSLPPLASSSQAITSPQMRASLLATQAAEQLDAAAAAQSTTATEKPGASAEPAPAAASLPSPSSWSLPAMPSTPSLRPSATSTPQVPPLSLPLRLERIKPPAPPPGTMEPDDMAELAREFADAAARFTPVGPRPPAAPRDEASAMTVRTAPVPPPPPPAALDDDAPSSLSETAATASLPAVSATRHDEPILPASSEASSSEASSSEPSSSKASSLEASSSDASSSDALSSEASSSDALSLEAPAAEAAPSDAAPPIGTQPPSATTASSSPSLPVLPPSSTSLPPVTLSASSQGDGLLLDDGGDRDFDLAEHTLKRAKQPPARPPSWMELADPGLESLVAPPSQTAALLDGILNQPGARSTAS